MITPDKQSPDTPRGAPGKIGASGITAEPEDTTSSIKCKTIGRITPGAASMTASMRDVLMAELRVHRLHLQLQVNDIDAVGVSLSSGLIGPEQAIRFMHDMGLGVVVDVDDFDIERRAA